MNIDGMRVVVVGGGAAGYFGAIRCAEHNPNAEVLLLEATQHLLAKVRISGGGRCNVTHACFNPRELVQGYPRGSRELLGALFRFGPAETIAWFESHGVRLKSEADGRVFPITDASATIVDCLRQAAEKSGVRVRVHASVTALRCESGGGFVLRLASGESIRAAAVLLATGGNRGSAGIAMAQSIGHTIEPQVPSLFTLHIDDTRLKGLEGVAVAEAEVSVPGTKLHERGPVLITHWGLSGPAILRLSAWGARVLHAAGYRFELLLRWCGSVSLEQAVQALANERAGHAKRQLGTHNPFALPARLWHRLLDAAEVPATAHWATLSNAAIRTLAGEIVASRFTVSGKSMNKEEFVTCGGVKLREVDFRTMESRVCPGLFFAGEILDLDGITGGFNFQAAWTTGWIAGTSMAEKSER